MYGTPSSLLGTVRPWKCSTNGSVIWFCTTNAPVAFADPDLGAWHLTVERHRIHELALGHLPLDLLDRQVEDLHLPSIVGSRGWLP